MKRSKTNKVILLLLTVCICSTQSFADAANEIKLKERSTLVNNRIAQLNTLRMYHQLYMDIRDVTFMGSRASDPASGKSIKILVDRWNQQATAWLDQWIRLQKEIDLHKEIHFLVIQGRVKIALGEQRNALRALKVLGLQIKEKADHAVSQLENAQKPNVKLLSQDNRDLESSSGKVIQEVEEFKFALRNLSEGFLSRYENLEALMEPTEASIRNRAQLAAIEASDREGATKVLKQVEDLVLIAKTIYPAWQSLNEKDAAAGRYALDGAYFHLKELEEEIQAECTKAESYFADLPVSEDLLKDERKSIETFCSVGKKNRSQNSSPVGALRVYRKNNIKKFYSRCEAGDPSLNCELFQILARLSPEKFKEMTPELLKKYEMSWDSIEKK